MQTVVAAITMATDASGTTQTLYFCDGAGWLTGASDTPATTYIEPRLRAAGSYSRTMFAGRALFGAMQASFGNLSLSNTDGGLDSWLDYGFDGRAVSVYVGEEGAAFPSAFTRCFTTEALRVVVGLERVELVLRDPMQALNAPVITNRFAGTGGLNGPSTLTDQPKPRCLGTSFFAPAVLLDAAKQIYWVCQEASTPGANLITYDGGVALTAGADYATTADLEATAPSAGQVRVYPSSPTYIRLGTAPTYEVSVSRISTLGASEMSTLASEAGLSLHGTYTSGPSMGRYVNDGQTTYLQTFTTESLRGPHWFGIDRDGLFVVRSVTDPAPGPSVASVNAHDLLSISRTAPEGVDVPVYRVFMRGDKNHSYGKTGAAAAIAIYRQEYLTAKLSEDLATLTKHPNAGSLSFEIGNDPGTSAANHLALHGVARDMFVCTLELLPEWLELDLGDIVSLTHYRMGLSAGRNLLVVGVALDFGSRRATFTLWG